MENGQFGPQLKIRFDLRDPEHADRSLTGWTSCKLSPKSKLYAWSRAAIFGGRAIPDAWEFDSDMLLNRRCMIVVGSERGTNGLGTSFQNSFCAVCQRSRNVGCVRCPSNLRFHLTGRAARFVDNQRERARPAAYANR